MMQHEKAKQRGTDEFKKAHAMIQSAMHSQPKDQQSAEKRGNLMKRGMEIMANCFYKS